MRFSEQQPESFDIKKPALADVPIERMGERFRGERGPVGPKGNPGPQGERGPKGDKGEKGDTGLKWVFGKDGKDGKDGRDGKDGALATPEEIKEKLSELKVTDHWFDWGHLKNIPGEIFQKGADGLISWGNPPLTVSEADGSPSVSQVTGLVFSNGSVTDNGDGTVTVTTGGSLSGTINEIAYFDTATSISSLDVTTYPSLTELSYVKGVTSAIQTQFTAKANVAGSLTQFVGNGNWKVFYSDGSGDIQELTVGAAGTYLQGNGVTSAPTWGTPAGSGDVSKVGTPVDNQIGVWTGDGTIEGDANFTWTGQLLTVKNTEGGTSSQVAIFENDSATPADNDEAYITLRMSDDGGGQTEVARITWAIPVDGATAEDGRLDFSVMTGGSLAKELQLSGADLSPSTDDGLALGTINLQFSDLFLASGGVITFANDMTITHSADTLTFAGGTVALGTATATGGLTGNVTGNVSGSAATVTGAAQTAITSLGTLTTLTVDDITINGNTISSAGASSLAITPTAGQAILLDATISIDAGVVTGITSLGVTGTRVTAGFFTDLTVTNAIAGSITGTAAVGTTVTVADETTDTSCFINFTTAATGNLGVKSNTNMTFNSNTGVATFASTVLTTTDINGGTVDGVTIGGASAGAITGTTITVNTNLVPDANDGAGLGLAATAFSDLFLASGAVIGFANSNVVLTHSSGILTMGTGDLRVTTAGTDTASVVTVGGTQTLTAKTLTSPTINTATIGGATPLAENASIDLDPALSADGKYSGVCITGTAGAALAFGDLIYLSSTDSRWELADADAATTADRMLGICVLAAGADGNATKILLHGNIRADAAFPALTIGSPVYVGETAGDVQVAIPTGADNVIRRVGYALTADELYFCPSMDAQTTVA